jgi:hypothetical protein
MTLRLAWSQAPEHVEGKEQDRFGPPPGRATQMLALAKPPSMSRGRGVYCMRKEEVVLDS